MTDKSDNIWLQIRSRAPLALTAAGAIALPFATGAFKNGWIAVALLACATWYVVAPSIPAGLQNAVVAIIAVCVAVSAVDLLLRPIIGPRLHPVPMNGYSRKYPRLPILGRWDSNVSVTREGYGDLAAMLAGKARLRESRTIAFQTDAHGFRNNPIHGQIDLLVLGDSFSAGAGISQEDMFSVILENRHGRRSYNLAFPGSPWEEYVNFMIESPRLNFAPGAVLVWTIFTGNDLDDEYGSTWNVAELPWRGKGSEWTVQFKTFRGRSPIRQLIDGVVGRLRNRSPVIEERALPDGRPMLFLEVQEERARRTVEEVERHPNFPKLERTLSAMRDAVQARGFKMAVLLFPTKGEVYKWVLDDREPRVQDREPSGFARAVLAACSRTGIDCIDTKPMLAEEAQRRWTAKGELLWWRDDTHLNAVGNDVVADFIAHRVLFPGTTPTFVEADGDRRL